MPESKKIPPGATTEAAMDNTNSRSQATSLRGKVKQTRSNGRLEGGRTGKEKGGFSKSQEEKLREYTAARKTVVGPGSVITSSSDRAVAECVDLKLTLKQRLDKCVRTWSCFPFGMANRTRGHLICSIPKLLLM